MIEMYTNAPTRAFDVVVGQERGKVEVVLDNGTIESGAGRRNAKSVVEELKTFVNRTKNGVSQYIRQITRGQQKGVFDIDQEARKFAAQKLGRMTQILDQAVEAAEKGLWEQVDNLLQRVAYMWEQVVGRIEGGLRRGAREFRRTVGTLETELGESVDHLTKIGESAVKAGTQMAKTVYDPIKATFIAIAVIFVAGVLLYLIR